MTASPKTVARFILVSAMAAGVAVGVGGAIATHGGAAHAAMWAFFGYWAWATLAGYAYARYIRHRLVADLGVPDGQLQ